ncbi:hypothetical protein GCM10020000_37690 [Streptomyces olivoverticillatus]
MAALPEGQRTRNASTEADRTVWAAPAEAAEGYDRGELLMMPPTISTLRSLRPYATVAEVLAAAPERDLTPVLAQARLEGGEVVLSWPGYEEFTKHVEARTDAHPDAGSGSDSLPESGSQTHHGRFFQDLREPTHDVHRPARTAAPRCPRRRRDRQGHLCARPPTRRP